jgi:hypothetical protein
LPCLASNAQTLIFVLCAAGEDAWEEVGKDVNLQLVRPVFSIVCLAFFSRTLPLALCSRSLLTKVSQIGCMQEMVQNADGKSGKREKKRAAGSDTKTGGKKKKVQISDDELFDDSM